MDPDRHAFLLELIRKARALHSAERDAFLAQACAGDPQLQADLARIRFEIEEAILETTGPDPDAVSLDSLSSGETIADLSPPFDPNASTMATRAGPARMSRSCPVCHAVFPRDVIVCPHDGEPLENDPTLMVGTILDGIYHVEALIGSGGMGTVFRARHVLLGDIVAIKVLLDTSTGSAHWLKRFLREGQAARRFRHPNAVVVHDLRVSNDGPVYLVLEYVDGVTLRTELQRRSRFKPADALEILEQIAGALDTAHAAGVVHRDLKPENVMLGTTDGSPVAKVVDLGLARLVEESSEITANLTQKGTMLGTPRYMSPEQWGHPQRDGNPGIDGRSDVYSLAVTAFEMLSGRPPFDARNKYSLRDLHIGAVPPLLNSVLPGESELLARAVDSGLAKDRADRPQSAGAFVGLVRAAVEMSALSAHETLGRSAPARRTTSKLTFVEEAAADGWNLSTIGGRNETVDQVTTRLPHEATTYVGRRDQIDAVCELEPFPRILTLVGAGGIGKTRMALQAARERGRIYADGVAFVDLAAVTDPGRTASAIAAAAGVSEQPDRPMLEVLTAELAGRSMLLILDNCEHLRASCARIAGMLAASCPRLDIVATSREPLGLATERVWPVVPLAVPDAAARSLRDVAGVESVALFVDRVRQQRPAFALTEENCIAIAALCVRLDGLPLAIELAAARCGVLTPAQVLDRLTGSLDLLATRQADVPARQRTLRASIDWSVHLLEVPVRRVLAGLSVFRGGWTLESAEAVCGAEADVVDALERLCEASLVIADDAGDGIRFRMLEMIREYAQDQFTEPAQHALSRRHATWIADLVDAAGLSDRNEKPEAMAKLDAEIANIWTAVAFGMTPACDPHTAVRLVAGVLPYWAFRGQLREGRAATEAALSLHPLVGGGTRATALNGLSMIALIQSEPVAARQFANEALELFRATGDERGAADALERLARVALTSADYREARAFAESSAAIWERLGLEERLASMWVTFGWISQELGEFERSRTELERAIEPIRRADNRRGIAVTLVVLSETLHHLGESDRGLDSLRECSTIAAAIGHRFLLASAEFARGLIERDCADFETGERSSDRLARAEIAADRAIAMDRELEVPDSLGASLVLRGSIALRRGDIDGAADRIREGTLMRYKSSGRRGAALGLEAMADVAAAQGAFERAARLLGAADAERSAVSAARSAIESRQMAVLETRLVREIGPEAFAAKRKDGRMLSIDEAIEEATRIPGN